ncbi:interleukin-10 receptor subunit beta [Triplophysa rosa]|uniref:Cytokine receptor family member B5 n=1 Tax=Triplophysa rosa TaxID=992332 RepID=A0A9W8C728_TRIRA|nr:interleukin-10 receptor subunit beta [Triplophysa rosa]KAI7809097.1 cytokine receptor family member B5 [Triplophysa rosa]
MHSSCWYNCAFFLLLEVSVVFGDLSSPQNLTLHTLNTHYILQWDWGHETAMNETVTFTAQYIAQYKTRRPTQSQNWKSVCVNVVERRCDFTDTGLFYFGLFLLRVQAKTARQSSCWVQIEFCPDKHAAIGPPSSVQLNSIIDGLEIIVADPLDNTNQSMKDLVQNMNYLIQYWKKHEDVQKADILWTKNNFVTLSELEKWTWYCVIVQTHCEFYNKSSVYSDTHCTQTGGETTNLMIFLYFLISLVLFFLLFLVLFLGSFKTYKTLKSIFYPSVTLPSYILEHRAADSDMPRLLIPEPEMFCEHLDITSAEVNAAITVMEQDQGIETHSQHDSGDSGFISTEEDSCHKEYRRTQRIKHNEVHMEDMCKMNHREEIQDGMMGVLCLKQ